MKVLGLVFSLLGDILTFVAFAITLVIMGNDILMGTSNITLYIVMSVITVVLAILASIGNKIQDREQSGLKLKYNLFKFIAWIPTFISLVASIAGVIILIYGLLVEFAGVEVSGLDFVYASPSDLCFIGAYMFIAGVICHTLYGDYTLLHCKYCGCNLKGGDYDYEEIEREYSYNSDRDEERLVSRIKFTFYCPECDGENIVYKKMKTDEEKVDRFARSVVGKE